MSFALQLVLGDLPKAHPSHAKRGLLQLFFCTDCDHGRAFSTTHLVRVLEAGEPLVDAPKRRQTWAPKPIRGWKKASDLPYREPGLPDFDRLTKGLPAEEEQLLFTLNLQRDKAGGWPNWVQDNSYPACPDCRTDMRTLVVQLGSNDHLPHRFGDHGVAFVLQCEEHPRRLSFVYQSA